MKRSIYFICCMLSFGSYAQISFENGYYIDNSGQKVSCKIKNIEWLNNPTEFQYKLSDTDESKVGVIDSIQEFEIAGESKYIRSRVKIDRSSENISNLSTSRNPIFNEETLFLKVLVQGKANLYFYEDGEIRKYFYNLDGATIEQLIFKSYRAADKVGRNNMYWQQLSVSLKCQGITENTIKYSEYSKDDLVKLFLKYNNCMDPGYVGFEKKQKEDLFNLTLRLGLTRSSLSIQNVIFPVEPNSTGEWVGRYGVEAEFILPFNKNKWTILLEPAYQYFKTDIKLSTETWNVDYKSMELPMGIRYYFFLNDHSSIFTNAVFVFNIPVNSEISREYPNPPLIVETNHNIAFGLGYKYGTRFSFEFRYGLNRKILVNYVTWNSEYRDVSLVLGYSIF